MSPRFRLTPDEPGDADAFAQAKVDASKWEREGEFKLVADFAPSGDQPAAIDALVDGLNRGHKHQTPLSVTGRPRPSPWPTPSPVCSSC
jgi:hypothetical protein